MSTIVKLKAGKYLIPVVITPEGKNRLVVQFGYNKELIAEIKAMQGARYHGFDEENPRKLWSISDCARNRFQLDYLEGKPVYEAYDKPLFDVTPARSRCMTHQKEFISHFLTRRQCVVAGQMGTGKSLAAIEAMELSGAADWIWVGPRSALVAVQYEFKKWESKIRPLFLTYDGLRKIVNDGYYADILPEGIVFDESAKLKNPTTQRSQAAYTITEAMRALRPDCFIFLLTGAPAPKAPSDWWSQSEVACPGFIREGDVGKFTKRLCLTKEEQSIAGGTYPRLITWLDNSNKCKVCGQLREKHTVGVEALTADTICDHPFEPTVNEVYNLYERLKGLVLVKFKKDCLKDLPEKTFRIIELEATPSVKRAADLILATSARTIEALIMSRELSDGFQYVDEASGETSTCPRCNGRKETEEFYDPEFPDEVVSPEALESGRCITHTVPCEHCKASGVVDKIIRGVKEVPCPKEQLLIDLLDEYEEVGRFVTFAGFEASVDRCVRVSLRYGWDVLRIDGRGWCYLGSDGIQQRITNIEMLERFQEVHRDDSPDKINVVGQAGAAGMGLTLTASPVEFFYSNSYNGEDRIQAMERIHRPGMDINKGATIIDCVHLPIDRAILNNLGKKINLQEMSMGWLREAVNNAN